MHGISQMVELSRLELRAQHGVGGDQRFRIAKRRVALRTAGAGDQIRFEDHNEGLRIGRAIHHLVRLVREQPKKRPGL